MESNPQFRFGEKKPDAAAMFLEKAEKSTSLKWYVDVESHWPLFLQYVYLWVKRYVFRRDLA